MHPVLQAAVDEALDSFGRDEVTFAERADGSVKVTVSAQDVGTSWEPSIISVTAILLTTFPTPPPYPFYLPAGLRKADGSAVPNMTAVTIDGADAMQLSVRPQGNRAVSSFPALISGVVSWLRDR